MVDAFEVLVTFLLVLSLAAERLVTIVKTLLPQLSEEKKTAAQEVDLTADRPRRLMVQLVALAAAWLTTGLVASEFTPANGLRLSDFAPWTTLPVGDLELQLLVVAILVSGGSALWNNVLGFTKALKDTKQVEKAASTLTFHEQAERHGATAVDSGVAARRAIPDGIVTKARVTLGGLRAKSPPPFNA